MLRYTCHHRVTFRRAGGEGEPSQGARVECWRTTVPGVQLVRAARDVGRRSRARAGSLGMGGKGGPMDVHIDLAALALIVSITLMVGMILGVSLSRPRR